MSVLYLIMGKSASGKDTLYKRLKEDSNLSLKSIVPYTTRPKREGEKEGQEYHFVSLKEYQKMVLEERVIESRTYHTVHGDWTYFTADDGQFIPDGDTACILIGTLDTYKKICDYYRDKCTPDWVTQHIIPLYVEVEDGERLHRALLREERQPKPRYAELCRRFLADEEDFSDKKLEEQGISKRFLHYDTEQCLKQIKYYINRCQ